MSLQTQLTALAQAVGADVMSLSTALPARSSLVKLGHLTGFSTLDPPSGRTAIVAHQISSTAAGRFRVYRTASQRAADASRVVTVDPVGNHGCVLEVVWTAPGSFDIVGGSMVLANGETLWYTNWEPLVASTPTDLSIQLIGLD